jgi:TAG lipase/lysophosphatidylethanolamine acyltransferase
MVAALACSVPDSELISTIDKISSEMPPLSKEYSSFGSVFEGVISSLYPPEIMLFEQYVRTRLGNMTFEDAYLISEKVLNITVTPKPGPKDEQRALELPRLMNYLTTPNVIVWTAIRASIGTGILPGKVEILAKNHRGEIVPYLRENVDYLPSNATVYLSPRESPYTRLSELFNVNCFIVSLTRPYFAPLLLSDFKHRGHRNWGMRMLKLIRLEVQHRVAQLTETGLLPVAVQRIFVDEDIPGGFQVAVVPEPQLLRDFGKVFDSHNIKEKVDYWIQVGEQGVWPMMAIIWARCAIEIALDNIYRKISS